MTKEHTYDVGRSLVRIRIGNIVDSTTEVVVSSDDDRISATGGVSQSLHRAGGEAVVDDARKHPGIEVGQVVVGTAGHLPAKYVFHAITRQWGTSPSKDREQNRRAIETMTRQCLTLLASMKLSSIEFPAIGAGFAGFRVEDVAVEMSKVIVNFLHGSELAFTVVICLDPRDLKDDLDYHAFLNRFDHRADLVDKVVRDHAVFMVHGIRTEKAWFDSVADVLKAEDRQLAPCKGGYDDYFDGLRFLWPAGHFREPAIRCVQGKLNSVLADKRIRRVSIIAHSFGTYIVGEMIKRDPRLKVHRLILCGSVLPSDFDWVKHREQVDALGDADHPISHVINDCGWRDVWPVLAKSATWGYGAAGRYGFNTPPVVDRFHALGHSDFFDDDFVRKYWVPVLARGAVVLHKARRPLSALLTQWLLVLHLKYILIAALVLGAVAYWRR